MVLRGKLPRYSIVTSELWQSNLTMVIEELVFSFGEPRRLLMYLSQISVYSLRREGGKKLDLTRRELTLREEVLLRPAVHSLSSSLSSSFLPPPPYHLGSGTGRDYLFNTSTGARRWI
jgi:hypothetical protein